MYSSKLTSLLFGLGYILLLSGAVFMVPDIFIRRFYTFQALWVTGGIILFFVFVLLLKCPLRLCSNTKVLLVLFLLLSAVYSTESLRGLTGLVLLCCLSSIAFNAVDVGIWRRWIYRSATWITLLQVLLGLAQYFHYLPGYAKGFITGSFDNPAGFATCLMITLPFSFPSIKATGKYERTIAVLTVLLTFVTLLLSESRTGILAFVVSFGLWMYCETSFFSFFRSQPKLTKWFVCGIILLIILCVLYLSKINSANGRLLIWQISLSMIASKPWTGYGFGGFFAHYMPMQGHFFSQNPEHAYAILADNTTHAFNEYIEIAVNYGLFGILIIVGYSIFLVYSYCKRPTAYKRPAIYGLVSLAVISMFSYPFSYPFVWLQTSVFTCILTKGDNWQIKIPYKIKLSLAVIICIIIGSMYKQKWNDERKWYNVAQLSLYGQTHEMMVEYEQLYERMKTDGLFLYNYASELSVINEYEKSNQLLTDCMSYFNDSDVQFLLANNSIELQNYNQAEIHYKQMAAMCPNRFVPLYRLFEMYRDNGMTNEATAIAVKIRDKKIKIISPFITRIRSEVKEYLQFVSQPERN